MYHDWSLIPKGKIVCDVGVLTRFTRCVFTGNILQVKTLGELEIELNRATLMIPPQSVLNADVDLGTVESAVTGVFNPFCPNLGGKHVEGSLEFGLGFVPSF